MGLLKRGSDFQKVRKSGLLYTAEQIRCICLKSNTQKKQFAKDAFVNLHATLNSYGVLHFALLLPFKNQYRMIFNHGYTTETVYQSTSSKDFWQGSFLHAGDIIEENTWYSLEADTLESFLQLFSLEDREHISLLHCKFINNAQSAPVIIITTQQNKAPHITDFILDSIDDNFEEITPLMQKIIADTHDALNVLEEPALEISDFIMDNCMQDLTGYCINIFYDDFFNTLKEKSSLNDALNLKTILFATIKKSLDENSIMYYKNQSPSVLTFAQDFSSIEENDGKANCAQIIFDKITNALKQIFEDELIQKLTFSTFTSNDADELFAQTENAL